MSNSIFRQFCRCWVHKRFGGIRGVLKKEKFKCLKCANQQGGIPEDCLDIELNSQVFEIVF